MSKAENFPTPITVSWCLDEGPMVMYCEGVRLWVGFTAIYPFHCHALPSSASEEHDSIMSMLYTFLPPTVSESVIPLSSSTHAITHSHSHVYSIIIVLKKKSGSVNNT